MILEQISPPNSKFIWAHFKSVNGRSEVLLLLWVGNRPVSLSTTCASVVRLKAGSIEDTSETIQTLVVFAQQIFGKGNYKEGNSNGEKG